MAGTSMQFANDAEERMINFCVDSDTRDTQANRNIDDMSKPDEAPGFLSPVLRPIDPCFDFLRLVRRPGFYPEGNKEMCGDKRG
jgi:hypothetical protein